MQTNKYSGRILFPDVVFMGFMLDGEGNWDTTLGGYDWALVLRQFFGD